MDASFLTLLGTAIAVAFIHTVIGVDHYVPFVALSTAERWTIGRTLRWTFFCGLAHVGSTLLLLLLVAAMGWAVGTIGLVDQVRGDIAAYFLVTFGLSLAIYDLTRGGHKHCHVHLHEDGTLHTHLHRHQQETVHQHEDTMHHVAHQRTFWLLFIAFALGPCEALVPLMLIPSLQQNLANVAILATVYAVITVATMCALVMLGCWGLKFVKLSAVHHHARAFAGLAVSFSGLLILFGL